MKKAKGISRLLKKSVSYFDRLLCGCQAVEHTSPLIFL